MYVLCVSFWTILSMLDCIHLPGDFAFVYSFLVQMKIRQIDLQFYSRNSVILSGQKKWSIHSVFRFPLFLFHCVPLVLSCWMQALWNVSARSAVNLPTHWGYSIQEGAVSLNLSHWKSSGAFHCGIAVYSPWIRLKMLKFHIDIWICKHALFTRLLKLR